MCNKCFQGLWCVDEQAQLDKYIRSFVPKRTRPARPTPPAAAIQPQASRDQAAIQLTATQQEEQAAVDSAVAAAIAAAASEQPPPQF